MLIHLCNQCLKPIGDFAVIEWKNGVMLWFHNPCYVLHLKEMPCDAGGTTTGTGAVSAVTAPDAGV